MSRRELRASVRHNIAIPPPPPPPSKCAKVLYYTWKLCSVVFSHLVMISLVVAYCILGAVTFEKLEAEHERERKASSGSPQSLSSFIASEMEGKDNDPTMSAQKAIEESIPRKISFGPPPSPGSFIALQMNGKDNDPTASEQKTIKDSILVKRNISYIRSNTTQSIWSMTRSVPLLNQTNWTSEVVHMLKEFENSLLLEMKVRGWDGNESTDHIQWTFTGALFYSIIVITTIGYGHIAPKTQTGKVVTIFYAILGIPLMLLCLSNIGDVMASSFRFLYWRVCCYVCTRPPKRRRRHHPSTRRSARGRPGSMRRRKPLERAHSDTDFRYRDSGYSSGRTRRGRQPPPAVTRGPRTRSQPPSYNQGREYDQSPSRYEEDDRDEYEEENEDFPKISLPLQDLAAALKDLDTHQQKNPKMESRSKSLPRPAKHAPDYGPKREWDSQRHYEPDDGDKEVFEMHDLHDVDYENFKERKALEEREKRRKRVDNDYESYRDRGYDPEDEDFEFDAPRYRQTWRRKGRGRSEYYERDREQFPPERQRDRRARSAVYDYGHRWEEHDRDVSRWPDVETGRRKLRRLHTMDETAKYGARYTPSPARDEWSDEEAPLPRRGRSTGWNSRQLEIVPVAPEPAPKEEIKPVPIWLCVFLVASYIVAGTFLFKRWEGWAYLDAAYFCFITLTTIGFGDFVPAQGESGAGAAGDAAAAVHSIALCSLYLLFGIALLAMSFNLVQEEVRANVAALATKLGIIKPERADDDDEESDY